MSEVGWEQQIVQVFCDNKSAIKLMKNPTFHVRTKHMSGELCSV